MTLQLPQTHPLLDLVLSKADDLSFTLCCRHEWQFHIHGVARKVILFRLMHCYGGNFVAQSITNLGATDRRRKVRESRQIIYRGPSFEAAVASLHGFVEGYLGNDLHEELI